jgi:hypothetical protein
MVSSERDTNTIVKWDSDCIQGSHSELCGQIHKKRKKKNMTDSYRATHSIWGSFVWFFLMEQILHRIYDSFSPRNASPVATVARNCVMTMINLTPTKPCIYTKRFDGCCLLSQIYFTNTTFRWMIGQPSSSDCSDIPSLFLHFQLICVVVPKWFAYKPRIQVVTGSKPASPLILRSSGNNYRSVGRINCCWSSSAQLIFVSGAVGNN